MGLFTSAPDKVSFKKLKEEGCVVTFSVTVPPQLVADEQQNALMHFQQRARLPGFRPGKAPLDLIKKQFSGSAKEEAVDRLIRKNVPEACKELQLRPIATPSVEDLTADEGKELKFTVKVEVAPKVVPKDYTKLAVTKKSYPADDKTVDARVTELREGHARLDKASEEAVGKSHYVVVDFTGPNAKGENELVDMSSEQTVEGLNEGLLGMKRGEGKLIPVKISGKDVALTVTIKEIKTKVLPEVDAEFAKDLGFETVDALRAKLKEVIEEEGKSKSEREVIEQIEQGLLKGNSFPLPPALVEAQQEHMLQRLKRQLLGGRRDFNEAELAKLAPDLKSRAEAEVRMSLLLPAIAEKEKLSVSDAELQAELEKSLTQAEDEKQKAGLKKMFEERKDELVSMLRDRKVMAFLKDKASVKNA